LGKEKNAKRGLPSERTSWKRKRDKHRRPYHDVHGPNAFAPGKKHEDDIGGWVSNGARTTRKKKNISKKNPQRRKVSSEGDKEKLKNNARV